MARPQRGARTQDRRRRQTAGPSQLPRGLIRNPYPPMTILSDDEVEAIHHASLQILRDIVVIFCCRRRATCWPAPAVRRCGFRRGHRRRPNRG
ncbi:MAG: trimethylamine methyltransferase family protein [Pseudomonadota bacterium]|nr:trimethylamine methyltransferase family protein [Pseudomonadota bacterium]